jgi:16S rRNA (guanine966-N2)-methyltransferase
VLRIIGGAWRGRRFRFPAAAQIRPTPDRVRETLFNWLGPRVVDACCLDLFAGSGALGLEALSRGASSVVFVDHDPTAMLELQARLTEWGGRGGHVERGDAMSFLQRSRPALASSIQGFHVVFLDPPFDSSLLPQAAQLLETQGWLLPGSLIYVEHAARGEMPRLPENWQLIKAKRAGEVGYHLYERGARGGATP